MARDTPQSSFQEFIGKGKYQSSLVVEFGCGDGRDSIGFSRSGCKVLGLDLALQRVNAARRRCSEQGLDAVFQTADVGKIETFEKIVSDFKFAHTEVLFYSRFFIHSLNSETLDSFLDKVGKLAASGDKFALEFRTNSDKNREKVFGDQFRNFVTSKYVVERLKTNNFSIVLRQERNGFAPYKDEDPIVCRLVAVKL